MIFVSLKESMAMMFVCKALCALLTHRRGSCVTRAVVFYTAMFCFTAIFVLGWLS